MPTSLPKDGSRTRFGKVVLLWKLDDGRSPKIDHFSKYRPVKPFLISVAILWSKAWVCGRWLAGIAGSNPAGGMDVWLLGVLCVIR